MKSLNLKIINEVNNAMHECRGKCSGKNGGDGYCYHKNGTRHKVGICKSNHLRVLNENR